MHRLFFACFSDLRVNCPIPNQFNRLLSLVVAIQFSVLKMAFSISGHCHLREPAVCGTMDFASMS